MSKHFSNRRIDTNLRGGPMQETEEEFSESHEESPTPPNLPP